MVSRDKLINAVRSKGFRFKRETERIDLFKQRGASKRVEIRKRDFFDRKSAIFILRTAGFSDEELRAFLAECDVTHH